MKILELQEKFSKRREVFTRIKRGRGAMIYARTDPQGIIAYEVFKIKTRNAEKHLDWTKDYDRREIYPGNEDFGEWAWCCKSLDRAMWHFRRLEIENPPE